jgi:peptidoglycan/xylan/chitin deacetylase (PgdA/CDA1 family)
MKAITYHYVRKWDQSLPYFQFYHVDDFRSQINYLANRFQLLTADQFLHMMAQGHMIEDAAILSFDDGLRDHFDEVLPVLQEFGTFGLFYIAIGPYQTGRLLDVHRVHVLIGRYGGHRMLAEVKGLLDPGMMQFEDVGAFHNATYPNQVNDTGTTEFKRLLNYLVSAEARTELLDALSESMIPDEAELTKSFYMTPSQICELQNQGMIVGAHGITHTVLSTQTVDQQTREINDSFDVLEDMTGGLRVRSFSYPYGRLHTFTPETEKILTEANCDFAFTLDERSFNKADLDGRRMALPRYNCNKFPHGAVSVGAQRPDEDLFPRQ